MIAFKEVAERIDKSEENEAPIKVYELLNQFGIYNLWHDLSDGEFESKNKKRLICYYINRNWKDDDSCLSHKLYLLDDVPVAMSVHNPYLNYFFFGLDKSRTLKRYLIDLLEREEELRLDFLDVEHASMNEFYKVYDGYNANTNKERAYYKGERVIDFTVHTLDEETLDVVLTESNKRLYNILVLDLEFKLHILDEK